MYPPSANVHLLISCAATLAQGTSTPQLQNRGIIPFRGAPEIVPPPRPIVPESPGSLGGVGGGVRPIGGGLGGGYSPAAGGWAGIAAAGGRGTAPESTAPFLANAANGGGNRDLAGKAVEAAGQVFDLLQNVVSLFDDDDDDDDTAKWHASTTAHLPRPTQAASTSDAASNATAKYILSRNNETYYTFLSDPRLMSKDVVAEMANANTSDPRLMPNQNLFTPSEYRMYLEDPICFYANIEGMYLEAFSSSTGASAPTPTPTQSLQRRQSAANNDAGDSSECPVIGSQRICPGDPGSPEWTSSQAAAVSALWATELPDELWSAHFATPTATASGEVTATATSTTSCSGLHGREGPVTQYRELKMRETSGGDAAATTSTNEVTGDAAKTGGKCVFGHGLVGATFAVVVGSSVL